MLTVLSCADINSNKHQTEFVNAYIMSLCVFSISNKKVQIGNDQEMAQSERKCHSINQGVGKKLK